jgi:predicted HTH domain antitoxin
MPITLDLPPDLERQLREEIPDLDAEAKIAVALDLFRKEQITIYELRLLLGLTRDAANALLVSRKEFAQSPTLEDVENDARTHSELFKARLR